MPPKPATTTLAARGRGQVAPRVSGMGVGQGMQASHKHTDAYMAQMYAAL
jgi:hypothetical protein